jgi:hypothetical protein
MLEESTIKFSKVRLHLDLLNDNHEGTLVPRTEYHTYCMYIMMMLREFVYQNVLRIHPHRKRCIVWSVAVWSHTCRLLRVSPMYNYIPTNMKTNELQVVNRK